MRWPIMVLITALALLLSGCMPLLIPLIVEDPDPQIVLEDPA